MHPNDMLAATRARAAVQVIHGRWAMLGVVGCLAPEVLAYEGIIPKVGHF
jgi:hypothetical protein